MDEPLYQVQKSVYVSKIQGGIGGHQFRNSSRTVPLEIRVDKVDEPMFQVQKSVYVSKIQSGIGGHQFRNSSWTVPLEIRVDKVDEPLYQVRKSLYVSKIQGGTGGHFRPVLGLYLWKSGWIRWMNQCTKFKNRYMSRKSRVV